MAKEEDIRFLLYRASAGSGKTYTLVKEYLKTALTNPDNFKHILAITFTNKAAGEMKERIILFLKKLSLGQDIELEKEIREELPELQGVQKNSSVILSKILHNYSDFAIMTIDSFIHRVVRAFALEMGLPLNFNIEINNEKIETYIVERLMSEVGRDDYITSIILEYIFSRIYEDKSWNIEEQIKHIDREILGEKNLSFLQNLKHISNVEFHNLIHKLQTFRDEYISTYNYLGREAIGLINQSKLSIMDFPHKEKGAAGFLLKCAELTIGDLKDFELGKRFLKEEWIAKTTPIEIRAKIDHLLRYGLRTIIQNIISFYNKKHSMVLTAVVLLDNIFLTALTNHMSLLIDEYKKKHNMIPISELNKIVYDIVRTSPVPFIYAIIGEKYNHYLMDEFQDTSRLQWENLLPLIDNSLSSGFFNMAVGDGKQSIYRWRGGDVEIMEKDIKEQFHPYQLSIQSLQKNFRSRLNIVNFNNQFFKKIRDFYKPENELLQNIYRDIQQTPKIKKGGFVSLRFFEEPIHKSDPTIDNCIKIIGDCVNRGYKYCDIVILVRQKIEGQKLAKELLGENIPVISPDSLILSKIPVIQFLMDILKYLNNPDDKILESSVIIYISLNKREPIDPNITGDYLLNNNQWELSPEISEFFSRKKYLIRMPVYEVIEEIIRIFRLNELLSFKSSGFLQSFLDTVAEFTIDNNADLLSFLDWWEYNKNEFKLLVPDNKNAIRIMTIHKAKGLEFPTVIIPYVDWNHQTDSQLWLTPDPPLPIKFPFDSPLPVINKKPIENSYYKKDLQKEKSKVLIDNINLLYVAFTRAKDSLYIISGYKKIRDNNYWFLKEFAIPMMKGKEQLASVYTWGEPVLKEKIKSPNPYICHGSVDDLISTRWFSKISIRRRSSEFWKFDSSYRTKRRRWGILVHQILSDIKSTDDLHPAIENALMSGKIESGERGDLKKQIGYILEIKEVKGWFKPENTIFTESRIITSEGVLRPDRVIISGDHVTIIDFKTGRRQLIHNQQMNKYVAVIKTMGYTNVDAFLLYLDDRSIIKVLDKDES